MPSLSLKIVLDEGAVTRKVKFNTNMTVKQALAVVKDKVIVPDKGKEYALFLRSADDDLTGVWLEDDRTLDYYMLRDGDSLDYICRVRTLRVKLLDDTVKTLQVDEAKTVGELMMSICNRIGITNYDEYGLCHDEEEETEEPKEVKEGTGTLTLKRKQAKQERDAALEQLSKKLKTDDNVEWLDLHRSLREQGIDPKETLLLKRRLYYSDRNVDSRDPVQLHLLYVQTRDTILNGTHPVTEQQAIQFAGIQCQVQLGDYQEKKHKTGFIEKLEEYLPAQYLNAWNVEKKIAKEFAQHQGLSELEAKFLYIKTARALPTYGVTFFLVKEKQKDKKKLVPRLLGINSHAILRLDEVTKEILQEWPLTHVKTYHAGKSQTFTLNFGDYSDKEYSVKTQDCHRIRDILEAYIDIIRRRMLAKPSRDPGESMAICHDNIQQGTSHLIQHVSNSPSKMVTETFVGPNKLITSEHGSQPQSGTMITTVQQLVVTDHLQNQQMALKGEMPLRGDMSKDCIKKLNRMNSNSVKIVGLLTDPTENDYEEIQNIVRAMKEDFPDIDKGVKETADKQAIEDAKKMLLDELHDLNNFMKKLEAATAPGNIGREGAKDAAENIADLTTQIYFSLDPKTRRRSELIRRSRNKMKAGEKSEQSMRRASFLAAANSAQHALDSAVETLYEDYTGPKPDAAERMKLEKALEDKMGKLNAAIALYLTAHSDPENIDYASAINSMNAINELMPEIAKDTQILASTLAPSSREQLLDDMQELCNATRAVCGTTSAEDHAKMQEATNQYAGIAGKLISTFARGTNADKEHEIIELAKDVGAKTSLLLVSTNELTCQAASEPAAADVDTAGVRVAGAATDLIACAQLTAPAIHEPHCQSALTAACEGISSSVHQLETAWRPLLEDQTRRPMNDQLHSRVVDVGKALERLKDAYANLEGTGVDDDDSSLPAQERKRLKFITTMNGAKGRLRGVEDLWNQQSATGAPSNEQKAEAQRRMEQSMAQLNAAIAALAAATADRENPDYATAELAIATISELMPQIVKDAEIASSDKDEATRNAMQNNIRALCEATRKICEGDGYKHVDGEEAATFAAASGKLLFLISPGADKGRQKFIMEEAAIAQEHAAQLVAGAHRLQNQVPEHTAAELGSRAARTADAANALGAVAQVTAPSISSPRCQDALSSAASQLLGSADSLTSACQLQAHEQPELQAQCAVLTDTHQQLADSLHRLTDACNVGQGGHSMKEPSAQQERKRLQFVKGTAAAKQRLDAAAQQLNKPMSCHMMEEGHAAALGQKLNDRLAQLNAAVAALAAATSDREHPDYEAAEKAVNSISQIMPHLIQDSQMLCGTKSDAEQAAMLQELRALCEATQELCDNAGQAQGVSDAAAKFSAASGKLVYVVSPKTQDAHEKQVLALAATSCGKASELLSQVQQLTERVADAGAAAELDRCGASAADAAQALLTVAQTTAPTINDPQCQKQLISAAQKLRGCADELTASCEPHTAQLPDARRQLGASHRQLADSLDKLIQTCRSVPRGTLGGVSSEQQEQQRLKFINSASGAKGRLNAVDKMLKEPLVCQLMKEDDGAALQRRLGARVAQLNAAVAALTAATADREHPDYAAADQAIQQIAQLMPQVVQESRTLCGTKSDAEQAAMLQELRALCEATQELCDNAGQAQGVSDAAAKFSAASGKLVYVVSPKTQDAHEKQVLALAATSCGKASELLSQVQQLTERVADAGAAAELDRCGASAADAAQALLTVAQTTAPTIEDPQCQKQLISAAQKLRGCADELTASCEPHTAQLPDARRQLGTSHRQLADSLDKLIQTCRSVPRGTLGGVSSEQQEQQRLKFINSASGAKGRLNAVDKMLKEPLVCQLMKEDDGAALQRRLGARVAQLNAAVAALTAATADREHPDYAAADQAIQQIAQLMPQVVQESRTLCGTKSDAEQAAMLQELRALCEATQELCDNAGQAQGVSDAAVKFSAASGKLVYVVSPKTQDAHEKQVLALAATSCGKASELLSQVQQLTERVADAGAAAELDRCGASAADAAQALLTVAQTTAPTINDPQCQKQLISAAQKLRGCADELTASCEPHTAQLPDARRQLGASHRQLADSLDKLMQTCRSVPHDTIGGVSSEQQEQQRLKFINSASGAKGRLNAVDKMLKEPLVCQLMKEDDGAALQRRLGARVAQLNAAVAALTAATADRKHPDYAAADQAIQQIAQLMPQVVQESRTLCGTKSDAEQAAMLQELRALCEATQELCDNAGQAQGVSDAAAKFSAASGKLVYVVSPKTQDAHEKQVLALAATSCGKASELLSQVQQLTERVADAGAAAELDRCGASAADAAQALLTVAQTTAPTINDPQCQKQLISAAQKLRGCADELTASCEPHTAQLPDARRQLGASHRQLADSLDKLIQTCRSVPRGALGGVSSEQQEQQRLKFINSASGAKGRLNAVDKMLKEPLVCQLMKEDDGAALQRRLGARVAQLNAAVAALTAATADREHPDYAAADQAIQQIAQLMPQVVQESRTLCGTKSDAEQAAMLQELRALCEATQELCDNAGQAQGVSDAAAKFSAASGKLVYVVSPKTQDAHEKQVLALAATSCGKASELLSQVQQLTERVADAGAAAELDRCGASAADAAQALLTVAQTTAPTISDPQCQKQVISSAQKLRRCADGLIATCEPHTAQLPDTRRQLGSSHRQLDESLDKLVQVCHSASGADVVLSPQQEQQRLKFVNSMSGAKSRLDTAEQQMKKPVIVKPLQQADTAVLQQQLSRRLAQLNAALAALAAATQDGKNPDYPAAERAVTTVIELMPEIVQDSHKICGTKEPAEQAAMMEELRELCEASRTICDSAGHPIKLNEASAKLADASSKLLYIVSPEGKRPGDATRGPKPAVQPRKPAVPARDSKHTVAKAVRSGQAPEAQSFLDAMRAEESGGLVKTSKTAEEEKLARKEFSHMIENAERGLKSAEEGLQTLYKTKNATTAGQSLPALEVVRREQHMEDTLAKAGIEVAALVSANYADKLDYKAAMKPTLSLTESVRSVVNDGSAICSSMPDDARKKFLEDMIGLCQSTKILCDTAKSDKEKLNDAAIVFGDQSVKLLRVVSCNVDPALEKEAISRAKAIGDAASRLALEATSLASSTSETNNPGTADSQVRDICAAGTSCVDSAGKLVYTAKLIAPTIHHETCQDALVSSADNLSSSLTTFSNTLAPLASTQHPNVQKLLGEAGHLEKLVEKLRKDVRAGKFGKRREVDPVVDLDFPLRNLTEKIIENAKNMVRDDTMDAQTKKQYKDYCGKLEEALRALDLANARYQRAPHDHNKRDEFEMNIDELQMTVLQARPARAGQEQNNIVDFRDFLQDLVNEAGTLEKTVRKNEGPIGKRTSEDIKMLCSKISEDASRLLNPSDNFGDGVTVMNTVDDILDIDLFGQECDTLVKEINNSIQGVQDQKTRQELLAKSLPMLESCYLLRFATNSHIMATQSSAYNEIIQNLDEFKSTTMSTLAKEAAKKSTKQTKSYSSALGSQCCQARASSRLVAAGQRAARGDPHDLVRAVTHYAVSSAARPPVVTMEQAYEVPKRAQMMTMSDQVEDVPLELEKHVEKENRYFATMSRIVDTTHGITSAHKVCAPSIYIGVYPQNNKANKHLKELSELDYKLYPKQVSTQVLNSDDIDRLLLCPRETVEGTPKQLEEKLQQLSSKLSSMGSSVVLSVSSPSSLARSLHAAAQSAVQLANTARALADKKRPAQCKLIEDAAHEMCLSTYSLLKTSELVCQEPNHHDAKRKLLEACRHLNDSINKLVRSTATGKKTAVGRACGEAGRSLALHRGMLQAAPRPPLASSYALSVHTMQSQRDVLNKLNSDEAMSREEFLKSMNYAVTAVNNSAECAAQAAYLISVSDQDKSIGLKGPVDVGKLQKAIQAVEETCISIITTNDDIQLVEEQKALNGHIKDLKDAMKDAVEKTKEGELQAMLKECTNELLNSHLRLDQAIEANFGDKEVITSKVADLMHDVSNVACLAEHPDLVPVATDISADTQKHVDEIVKNSLTLLSNTEDLVKQVKAAPEEPETMKWVMFNKRKDVLDAFENLLKSVRASGERVNLLEAAVEEPEEEKKSYVETQFDLASKWLSKPMCKPEVKAKGQEAVRNLVEVANKVAEDLQGSDKEDMRNLIVETEQLLKDCSQKYDHEQYSVLLERVRELKKGVSRGVVSKLVQDFMQAEEPLADLDLIAEYEQDESKRKFMLEKKIAELLAQLGRVTGTARLVAHTHAHRAHDINQCSQQTELLAPMLVKAAQERIARPDDKAVIENYKSLLAKYAESMSKIRDLCDQSVDPMEFVQTAGETIERMREESSTHNDPLHNAHTSTAISKLANRVIHVGMSSSTARRDPELQRALAEAQHQLAAATPAPDTRASRMPDFKDTTARILQATEEVESLLCGETIFKQQPTQDQPIFNEAMNLHVAIRDWSSRDNEIVAVAKRMAVLMAKLSNFMNNDKQREVLATSKSIVSESHEVARLAKKLAHECTDHRIKTNLLQTCERIPTISGQLKMLTTVKGFSLGRHGTEEDKEAMDMLVGNAQSLMLSIQDVVKGAASASVKIMSQRGPRMKWVRKTVY
ncbi:talin-2 isoform X47 [Spodoptera frugiperda]|uniref:Talin-2 isoform X47 n=1 Tax=Spodoptera frugiperda TaxID=7108 RepID=A0A9R0DYR5_SPOFR|nr:talin-2 isoform X47 [Spodoptera frugiperda]